MASDSNRFIAFIIFIIMAVYLFTHKTDNGIYSTSAYKILLPVGWHKTDTHPRELIQFQGESEAEILTVESPEVDEYSGKPKAIISIYSIKLLQATWIEDEMPYIISLIEQSGQEILEKGEIKIDDRIFKWILYKPLQGPDILNLKFYFVDDTNHLHRISYQASAQYFNKYRNDFEAMKNSIQFKGFKLTK